MVWFKSKKGKFLKRRITVSPVSIYVKAINNISRIFLFFGILLTIAVLIAQIDIVQFGGKNTLLIRHSLERLHLYSDSVIDNHSLNKYDTAELREFVQKGTVFNARYNRLSLIMNAMVLIMGIMGVIFTVTSVRRYWAKVENNQSIQSFSVNVNKGIREDLGFMVEQYSHAERITVYAGDFDWINDETFKSENDRTFKEIVTSLAIKKKIRLISDESQENVKNAIGEEMYKIITENDVIKFNNNIKNLRFSIIDYSNHSHSKLIYKYEEQFSVKPLPHKMCIVLDQEDTSSILLIIKTLMEEKS